MAAPEVFKRDVVAWNRIVEAPYIPKPPIMLREVEEVTMAVQYDEPEGLVFYNADELGRFLGTTLTEDHIKGIHRAGGFPVSVSIQWTPNDMTPGERPVSEITIKPEVPHE